jgi:hypothetical protein
MYYSEKLDTLVNKKYDDDTKTKNTEIASFTSSNINSDTYNFKVGDRNLNNILEQYYTQYYDFIMKNKNNMKIPNDFYDNLKNYNRHELMKPYNVYDEPDKLKLFFSIDYRSKIFSNKLPMLEKTEFAIDELKNINKSDHAYVTLFFPGYNDKMEISYGYLMGTLLVAYMLRNCPQNYSLIKNDINGTKANIVCMITPDIPKHIIEILKLYYDDVVTVPYIGWKGCLVPDNIKKDESKFIEIQDVSKGNINPIHAYSKVFTKLNIFNKKLLPYKKVILLDTDLFPLGYFDSLFSIDTPAGCIEHRRLQIDELGVQSWGYDRSQFVNHGHQIPKYLTDIENIFSSDINASLLIVTPDDNEFRSMINELQTPLDRWFGEDLNHKGFWLGNNYYDFYFLPEQNYLTKRFSGKWKSVDLGFSTWLIDIENCFGFTFAGFVVKPWEVQSAFHKYSVNPYSQFSSINNKISQKSYGYQIMNQYIFRMLCDVKCNREIYKLCKNHTNISFIFKQFDPWEPEFILRNSNYIKNIKDLDEDDLRYLSYDQKKLVYLFNDTINKSHLKKILYFDDILDNIGKHIYNLHFMALSYHLTNILTDLTDEYKIRLYPFGNTFTNVVKYSSFDIADDDNDYIMIVNRDNYRKLLLKLFKKLLYQNLQIFVCRHSNNEYIQIFRDDIKPLYYFRNNKNGMTYKEFKHNFDFNDFKYFNISYYSTIIDKILHDYNVTTTHDMYNFYRKNNCIKVPWIDVFLLFEENDHLLFEAQIRDDKLVTFDKETFENKSWFNIIHKKVKLDIIDKSIRIQKTDEYMNEYYGNKNRLNKYIIKSKHKSNTPKTILYQLDTRNEINNEIITNLFNYINGYICTIYRNINISRYLGC